MKKIIIVYTLLAIACTANAQTISRKVVSSAGGTLNGGGGLLTFSIGETFIPSLSASGAMITQGFQQPGEQIKTGTVSSTLCGGSNFNLSFTSIDVGGANVFTAQLSNASGSFVNPVSVGKLIGNASGGQINVTIPSNTPAGNGYRVRIRSSSPAISGTDNGTNITINAAPVASIIYSSPQFCNSGNINVSRTGQVGGTYTANPSGLNINSSNGKINLGVSTLGVYTVTYSFTNGTCSNTATTSVTITSCKGGTKEIVAVSPQSNKVAPIEVIIEDKYEVVAYPNPSAYQFNLVVDSSNNEKIEVIVYDVTGKVLKHFARNKEESIVFGDELPRGIYITKIIQGANFKTFNLIKE
jgi:hypothetical protein